MLAITHNGRAHKDDFLASCILIAKFPEIVIYRQEAPTEAQLADPSIFVFDFGKRLEPELKNFDHHQLNGGEVCAFTLILEHFGMRDYKALPWIKYVEIEDHCGIQAQIDFLGKGTRGDIKSVLASPIDSYLINLFSHYSMIEAGMPLYDTMRGIGATIINQYESYYDVLEEIKQKCHVYRLDDDINILDCRQLTSEQIHGSQAVHDFNKENKIDIVLNNNVRGGGDLRLVRLNHSKFDFNLVKDMSGIGFVHQSGFLVSFESDGASWRTIVRKSRKK